MLIPRKSQSPRHSHFTSCFLFAWFFFYIFFFFIVVVGDMKFHAERKKEKISGAAGLLTLEARKSIVAFTLHDIIVFRLFK